MSNVFVKFVWFATFYEIQSFWLLCISRKGVKWNKNWIFLEKMAEKKYDFYIWKERKYYLISESVI